jgi:hypothetical protein
VQEAQETQAPEGDCIAAPLAPFALNGSAYLDALRLHCPPSEIRNFHGVENIFHGVDNFFHAMEKFEKKFPCRGSSGFFSVAGRT